MNATATRPSPASDEAQHHTAPPRPAKAPARQVLTATLERFDSTTTYAMRANSTVIATATPRRDIEGDAVWGIELTIAPGDLDITRTDNGQPRPIPLGRFLGGTDYLVGLRVRTPNDNDTPRLWQVERLVLDTTTVRADGTIHITGTSRTRPRTLGGTPEAHTLFTAPSEILDPAEGGPSRSDFQANPLPNQRLYLHLGSGKQLRVRGRFQIWGSGRTDPEGDKYFLLFLDIDATKVAEFANPLQEPLAQVIDEDWIQELRLWGDISADKVAAADMEFTFTEMVVHHVWDLGGGKVRVKCSTYKDFHVDVVPGFDAAWLLDLPGSEV